ncbi:MAG: tetratricopeptide repeat protein, partial [Muribaculaceae bacterium]
MKNEKGIILIIAMIIISSCNIYAMKPKHNTIKHTNVTQSANKSMEQILKLAKAYYFGNDSIYMNKQKAFELFSKAAKQGNLEAQNFLGCCYSTGEGVAKDIEQAVYWFRKAAEQGFATAQFNLGLCYQSGDGVEKDFNQAVYWFRKAAEQGNAYAQCRLGGCYDFGDGVEKDFNQAVYWFRKA